MSLLFGPQSSKSEDANRDGAAPLDRFAAGVIDYAIVLMPFIYLILAPFQRAIKVAAVFGTAPAWGIPIITALSVFSVVVMIFLYQTLMVTFWGGTVGQLLLGLRVCNLWDRTKPRFGQSAMRSFFWFLSWIALGVPFLAIFGNELRRTIHDRVADTVVISVRNDRKVESPTRRAALIVSGIFWAVGVVAVIFLASTVISYLNQYSQQNGLIAQLEADNVLCEQVSDAQANWPNENGAQAKRLSVAMSLYTAGIIGRHCLQGEVENLPYGKTEQPLLDLAKSFVYADAPGLSQSYLTKICQLNASSVECAMSQWMTQIAHGKWSNVKGELAALNHVQKVFPFIWAEREAMAHNDYRLAWSFLQKLPDVKELADFATPQRLKLLVALGHNKEAHGVAAAAYSALDDDAKLRVSSFMCDENIGLSCAKLQSRGCQIFSRLTSEYSDALNSTQASLAYLRLYECGDSTQNPASINYEPLLSLPLNRNVKELVEAISRPGTRALNKIRQRKSLGEKVVAEATCRIIERTSNIQKLTALMRYWRDKPDTLAWQRVGEQLFNKLYQSHSYALSAQVGKTLLAEKMSQMRLARQILALKHSNQMARARMRLAEYLARYPSPQYAMGATSEDMRMPASLPLHSAAATTQFRTFVDRTGFVHVVEFLEKNASPRGK